MVNINLFLSSIYFLKDLFCSFLNLDPKGIRIGKAFKTTTKKTIVEEEEKTGFMQWSLILLFSSMLMMSHPQCVLGHSTIGASHFEDKKRTSCIAQKRKQVIFLQRCPSNLA